LADIAAVGPDIGAECSPQRAGYGDQGFQAGQPCVGGRGDDPPQSQARARRDDVPIGLDLAENRGSQLEDESRHPFIAHQRIRPTPQNPKRNLLLLAPTNQPDQFVEARRFGEELRWSPQLEPGVHRQRLALPHNSLETGKWTHD